MRNRTLDSTTPSSTLDSDDCWVWFVTEKGLRASGATSMKAAAADLRQMAVDLEKSARRLNQDMSAAPNGVTGRPSVANDLQVGRTGCAWHNPYVRSA